MLSRSSRKLAGWLIAAALLFAQAVGAVHACVGVATPAMAFAQTDHDEDCGKAINQNACLQQCTAGDQSSAQFQAVVAAMPAIEVLTVPVTPTRGPCPAVALSAFAQSPDPPSSIRFCSFQL